MKKYLYIFLTVMLLLSFTGLAQAQIAVDPKDGPEVWVTSVYNNSSSTVSRGDIVIWQISSSTGDNDNYITTTTTADTVLVAGIVYPADIATKKTGSIAVRATGIQVNTKGAPGAGAELCTSGTAGEAQTCSEAGDPNRVGFCTSANTTSSSEGSCIAYISIL